MEHIFTFQNTHHSIAAEQCGLDGGIEVRVMSLPSAIRAGCGLCIRVDSEDSNKFTDLLISSDIPYDGIFLRDEENSNYVPVE